MNDTVSEFFKLVGPNRNKLIGKIPIKTVSKCRLGCNTISFKINGNMIFKFPKDDKSAQKLKKEHAVLKFLNDKISAPIPRTINVPELSGGTFWITTRTPGRFINPNGKKMAGFKPAEIRCFCRQIAQFLAQMHAMTDASLKLKNIPVWSRFEQFPSTAELYDFLCNDTALSQSEREFCTNFCKRFKLCRDKRGFVFGHFDLLPKNICWDTINNKLSGIFDFGDCGMGHYMHDLAQVIMDFPDHIGIKIAQNYKKITGRTVDIQYLFDCVLLTRLCFFFKKPNDFHLGFLKREIKRQKNL